MKSIHTIIVMFFILCSSCSYGQNIIDMNLISINEDGDSKPSSFTPAASGFYFKVNPSFSKQDIYFTDGTEIGTQLVYDNPNNNDVNIVGSLGDNLFFSVDTAFGEETLFYFDKSINNITQLAIYSSNFTSSAFYRYILDFTVYNGVAYFSAYNSQTGYELHQSDGTIAGTLLTMDINSYSSARGSFPRDFTLLNGNLLFTADDISTTQNTYLSSIWRITSNGNIEKITNTISDNMSSAQIINNELYYLSYNQNTGQNDIYKTDGSVFNESIVLNYSSSPNQYIYKLIGNINDDILFTARKSNNDVNLESVNINSLATTTLNTLQSSATFYDSDDFQSVQLNNKIIFTLGVPFGPYDINLFRTDGTVTGSYFLNNNTSIQPQMRARIIHKTPNDHIIFTGENDTNGNAAFYHLDPSNDQITITNKIFGSGSSGAKNEFLSYNNTTYLLADDGLSGFELFSYDELQDIAIKIVDIENKGNFTDNSTGSGYPINSIIPFKQGFITFGSNGANSDFPNLANNIYFYDPTNQSINSLHEGALSFATNFIEQIPLISNDNYTIFAANNGLDGYEPWITDGTEVGTFQLRNINPNGSSIGQYSVFRKANNHFFFSADNGTNTKIYYTNGTMQGSGIFNPLNETGDYRLTNVNFSNNHYYFGYADGTNEKVIITDNNFNLIDSFIQPSNFSYFHVFNDIIITIEPDASTNYNNHDIYFQTNSTNRQFVGNFFSPYGEINNTYRFPRIRNTLTLNNQFHFIIGNRHIISTDGTIAGTTRTPTLLGGAINHLFSINNRIFATDEYLPNTTGKSANIVEINVGGVATDPFASVPSSSALGRTYTHTSTHIIRTNSPTGNIPNLTVYDVSNNSFSSVNYNIVNNSFPFQNNNLTNPLDPIFNENEILALGRSNEHGLELYSGLVDYSTLNLNNEVSDSFKLKAPSIYPNPVDRKFYINANNLEIIKINLYDLTGKEINITSRFNSTDNTIELSGIHKGIYILNIELINDTNHSIKVIKD